MGFIKFFFCVRSSNRIEKYRIELYLFPCRGPAAYLFDVRVEGDRHVQQDLALLHAAHKVLDPVLQLVGGLVDLLGVALARLGKLLGRLQQLVCIGVRVLRRVEREKEGGGQPRENAERKENS